MAFSAAILASILFLAAKIISSRLRCSEACLSSRFELHAFAFVADSFSPSALTFSCSLYLVIRSGSAGLGGALKVCVCAVEDGLGEGRGGGGWNVIGGCRRAQELELVDIAYRGIRGRLTGSIRPDNILSVVAAMFPPLRCRSHKIVLRSAWGNICCILSTAASLARDADWASRVGRGVWAAGEKKR